MDNLSFRRRKNDNHMFFFVPLNSNSKWFKPFILQKKWNDEKRMRNNEC